MLNTCIIMGRIGQDLELRRTENDVALLSFSIACDNDIKNKDGSRSTDWIDCTAWRTTAEFISKYFHKGSQIAVVGRLKTRSWEDKDTGKKRSAMNLQVDHAYFCETKRDSAAPQESGSAFRFDPSMLNEDNGFAALEDSDEQLPF